jgi:hypothetical protein
VRGGRFTIVGQTWAEGQSGRRFEAGIGLLCKIRETGRVVEPAPPRPDAEPLPAARELRGSAWVRCVGAGSCNGCEIEIGAAFGPVCDAEQYGPRLVASPRHADVLLVTGPVTRCGAPSPRRPSPGW